MKRGAIWQICLPAAAFAADRLTKRAATAALAPNGVRTAIPGVLSWAYTRNTGMSFSLLSAHPALLTALTGALCALISALLLFDRSVKGLLRAGLLLLLGGALGNFADRLLYGAVTDFIRADFVRFAVFNAADICVCAGAFLSFLGAFFPKDKEARHG